MNWQQPIRLSNPSAPKLLMALTQVPIEHADAVAGRHAQLLDLARGTCEVTCTCLLRGELLLQQWRAIYNKVLRLEMAPYTRFRAISRLSDITKKALAQADPFDLALTNEPQMINLLHEAGCNHVIIDLSQVPARPSQLQVALQADVILVDHAETLAQLPHHVEDRVRILPVNPALRTVATLAWNDAIARPFEAEVVRKPAPIRKAA